MYIADLRLRNGYSAIAAQADTDNGMTAGDTGASEHDQIEVRPLLLHRDSRTGRLNSAKRDDTCKKMLLCFDFYANLKKITGSFLKFCNPLPVRRVDSSSERFLSRISRIFPKKIFWGQKLIPEVNGKPFSDSI